MIKVGLTGGIGSGKSVISKILTSLNYPVFNSDEEAKQILVEDATVVDEMTNYFGAETYLRGVLNRPFLAEAVFRDTNAREKINSIVHPRVRSLFEDFSNKSSANIVFNEAAILFETGGYRDFDKMILVTAPEDIRIARVVARDNTSRDAVLARINAQWPDEKKRNLADFIIVNDNEQPVIPQVEKILEQLNQLQ